MMKKLTALFMALVLMLSMTACGGNSGGGYCDVVNVEYYSVHRRISKS